MLAGSPGSPMSEAVTTKVIVEKDSLSNDWIRMRSPESRLTVNSSRAENGLAFIRAYLTTPPTVSLSVAEIYMI